MARLTVDALCEAFTTELNDAAIITIEPVWFDNFEPEEEDPDYEDAIAFQAVLKRVVDRINGE